MAKTWKQPKWPLTDEWIKKMSYIYTREYYSVIIQDEIMPPAATWKQPRDCHTKQSMSEKNKYHMTSLYVYLNTTQMSLCTKQEQIHRKQTYSHQRRKVGGRGKLEEFGINTSKLLHIKQMTKMTCYITQGTLHLKHTRNRLYSNII